MKVTGRRLDQLEQKCLQNYLSILPSSKCKQFSPEINQLTTSLILSADSGFLTLCQLSAQLCPYCQIKGWPLGIYSQPRIHLQE